MSAIDTSGTQRTADPTFGILAAVSLCHLLNDLMQSLLPAVYPLLKQSLGLDYGQIGLLVLTNQVTASLLQPVIGLYTDKRPMPYFLVLGMGATFCGLLLLAQADRFELLIPALALVGMGSAIFHPESSRIARMASGGRHGLAQSLFQVGGNFGSALGPLLAAFVIVPGGQGRIAWFGLAALCGMTILWRVGLWYAARLNEQRPHIKAMAAHVAPVPQSKVMGIVAVLLVLIASKYFYMASLSNFYIFYLHEIHGVPIQQGQIYLFVFFAAVALGTLVGGPLGDRIGRRAIIRFSILGVLPFSLVLPYASLTMTVILTVPIGLILSSAFSAIVVYAQELMPGRVGAVAGMFFGFAFGLAGISAAILGAVADAFGIGFVYEFCSVIPALGLLAMALPDLKARSAQTA
jgi:FSR family fosmidomycin resistance protein-like MFS transporter